MKPIVQAFFDPATWTVRGDGREAADLRSSRHLRIPRPRDQGRSAQGKKRRRALGVDFRESDPTAEMNWCCGGGAGVFLINRAAGLRQKAFELKQQQIDATGAETVVMSCGSCRLNFMSGQANTGWPVKIESLVELVGDNLQT